MSNNLHDHAETHHFRHLLLLAMNREYFHLPVTPAAPTPTAMLRDAAALGMLQINARAANQSAVSGAPSSLQHASISELGPERRFHQFILAYTRI